jgi:hypothetical protein
MMNLLAESSKEAVAAVLRIYGFEGLLTWLQPRPTIDERIVKLAQVQTDLEAAIEAVKVLRRNADESKAEAEQLKVTIDQLQQDKNAAEELVKLPEEAVLRLIARSNATGRGRGLIEGIIIGLVTGFLSSLLVWYLTKQHRPCSVADGCR